jgi:hypothetical protein
MTGIELSQAYICDIEDAMDDPSLSDKHRTKLLVIRMHRRNASHREPKQLSEGAGDF